LLITKWEVGPGTVDPGVFTCKEEKIRTRKQAPGAGGELLEVSEILTNEPNRKPSP